jgi:amidase
MTELTALSACAAVELLKKEEVSPLDLLDALEKRIAKVDPLVNALPTLCFERAREHARGLLE